MELIFLLLYFLTVIVLFMNWFIRERITPVTIFIFSQGLFFAGFIKYLDFSQSNDWRILFIYWVGILSFAIGASINRMTHPIRIDCVCFTKDPIQRFQRKRITLFILLSLLLCAFFLFETRFSTVKIMFSNLLSSSGLDVTEARIASYSVPGTALIYAIRISILPTIVTALIRKENSLASLSKCFLVVFMIFFTLITGQRGGFMYVMFMWILSYLIPIFYKSDAFNKKKQKRSVIIIGSVMLVTFFFMSVINGRVSGTLVGEVIQRFFDDNQGTAYYGFQYIFEHGTCWGRNYFEEIVNLMVPGDKYMPLSKIIFGIMYGSTRGTAPVCLWGSLYYNFSWIGIIVVGIVYGSLCHYVGYRLYSRKVNSLRIALYSYMFIDTGMLLAGGPLQLFNNGFVPLIILAYILHVDRYAERVF